jgi:hypothetical protein
MFQLRNEARQQNRAGFYRLDLIENDTPPDWTANQLSGDLLAHPIRVRGLGCITIHCAAGENRRN